MSHVRRKDWKLKNITLIFILLHFLLAHIPPIQVFFPYEHHPWRCTKSANFFSETGSQNVKEVRLPRICNFLHSYIDSELPTNLTKVI
jgi:hypothetical protein